MNIFIVLIPSVVLGTLSAYGIAHALFSAKKNQKDLLALSLTLGYASLLLLTCSILSYLGAPNSVPQPPQMNALHSKPCVALHGTTRLNVPGAQGSTLAG